MSNLSEGVLLGLGNPLLDISCSVDQQFLESYGLLPNDAILANEKHINLCKEMVEKYKDKVEYFAGGAVQNSMRVTQWFLTEPNCVTFMGAIGVDHFAQQMYKKAKEDKVNVVYMTDNSVPTGTCACLITNNGKSRSLCAYLGASQKFKINHLLDNNEWVEKAKVFYVSGFHLAVSPESILYIANHAHNNEGKVFCMNLSAPYISQVFSKPLLEVFPYVDILFGNETEAQAFADLNEWQTKDLKEIAKQIADKDCKRKEGRTVVITQGKDNVLVAFTHENEVKEFSVTQLEDSNVIDTNGAGDAFVGGFLAQYIQNKPLKECIESGIYAATEVIQLSGCTFPKDNHFRK